MIVEKEVVVVVEVVDVVCCYYVVDFDFVVFVVEFVVGEVWEVFYCEIDVVDFVCVEFFVFVVVDFDCCVFDWVVDGIWFGECFFGVMKDDVIGFG